MRRDVREDVEGALRRGARHTGMARKPATMRSRRRAYSASMAGTESWGRAWRRERHNCANGCGIRRGTGLQLSHPPRSAEPERGA